jgi:hypothetical protein
MIRGWFTARLLNQLNLEGGRTEIWDTERSKFVGFPHPLLGPGVHEEYERLPALLESLPLALIEVGSLGVNGMAALRPYTRLRDLGQDARGGEYDYQAANKALAQWILGATIERGAPIPSSMAGSVEDGWEERKKACDVTLAELEINYEEIFSMVPTRENFFEIPRVWELRSDYVQVLKDLRQALAHVRLEDRAIY